jgi:hypothetical protein
LPKIFSQTEFSEMSAERKNISLRYEIEQNTSLDNRVFSGCLFDEDLNLNNNGYLFQYYLSIKDYKLDGETCVINNAELCLGTKTDGHDKVVDVNKEIANLTRCYNQYQKLAYTQPDYVGSDGLTYMDLVCTYDKTIKDIKKAKEFILAEVKTQIKDRINTEDEFNYKVININNVKQISFGKCKMHLGSLKWRQVS